MPTLTAIGLMSGTSYDGVDLALIETDGERIGRFGMTGYRPYSVPEREVVRHAIAAASNLSSDGERPRAVIEAEQLITDMHAEAVEAFLAASGLPQSSVAVVGFHGQTVLHRPDRKLSIQLGNGEALAARIGIPVVYNFRAADIAAGGQGAPVVPIFHRAMCVLDETDSGLDIDALKVVAEGVNRLRSADRSFLVITHYQRLLNYIVPDVVHVLSRGRIVKTGGKELALELEASGYSQYQDEAA